MTDRDDLRALADEIRGDIPSEMGLRQVAVFVLLRTETGAKRPGMSGGTITDTWTRVVNNGKNPKLETLKSRDILASGGVYEAEDVRVGPFTPVFPTGGNLPSAYDPDQVSPGSPNVTSTVYVALVSPAAEDGAEIEWYTRVNATDSRANFRRTMIIRRIGVAPIGAVVPTP